MEEGMKNRLFIALAILTLIFFILTVSSCLNGRRQRLGRDKEMALRMDLEEKISKVTGQNARLEEKAKELERLTEEEKKAQEATKKTLSQEQLVNKSMREELEKITKLKETLERDLKEALVNCPKKTSTTAR